MIFSTRFRGLAFHSSSFWELGIKCLNEVEILGLFLGGQEVYLLHVKHTSGWVCPSCSL